MQFCIFCQAPAVALLTVSGATEAVCETDLAARRRQHEQNLTTFSLTSLGGPTSVQVENDELRAQIREVFGQLKAAQAELETSNRTLVQLGTAHAAMEDACEKYADTVSDLRAELTETRRQRDEINEALRAVMARLPQTSEPGTPDELGGASAPGSTGATGADVSGSGAQAHD
jgi:seryl-tRNA synthetase